MRVYPSLIVALLVGAAACDTPDPTKAVIDNASQAVVYRAWWAATLFEGPVPAGASSDEERCTLEADYVYALLAPGWDPASGSPPAKLVAVRSKEKLAATRGDTLHIVVSDATFGGSCDAKQPLSQADADFITQRIFPGAFAGATYDATTCTTIASLPGDAGTGD